MDEEILSGIKSAKARGYSVEQAAQSFINAGYNPAEVQEAASFVSKGFSQLPKQVQVQAPSQGILKQGLLEKPKASKALIISLIILAIIIVSLGLVLLLFRDRIFS